VDLDAIKKRRADFDNAMREQGAAALACPEDREDCGYCELCEKAGVVAEEFWGNVEDDEAALIEEVERLQAELRKFYKCEDDAICEYPRRVGRIHDGIGDIQYQIWHKET
jgi:hypothetical protein